MAPFIEAATVAGYVIAPSGEIVGIIWSVAIALRGREFIRNVYNGGGQCFG